MIDCTIKRLEWTYRTGKIKQNSPFTIETKRKQVQKEVEIISYNKHVMNKQLLFFCHLFMHLHKEETLTTTASKN